MRRALFLVLPLVSVAWGCGRQAAERVTPPTIDPDAITAAVMAKADRDADGVVEQSEFRNAPSLAAALAELDANRDGGISEAELRAWLAFVKDSGVAISQLTGVVMHRQKPLANVVVTLVPEPCMGSDVATARAVTDAEGRFAATIPGSKYPGVHCGLYRVDIAGMGNDGKPLAPSHSTQPPLGLAVGGMLPHGGFVTLTLDDSATHK